MTHEPSILFEVKPDSACAGFDLICDRLLPYDMWYAKLYDAVVYAMETGREHRCEIRIYDRRGICLETLQTEPEPSEAQLMPD